MHHVLESLNILDPSGFHMGSVGFGDHSATIFDASGTPQEHLHVINDHRVVETGQFHQAIGHFTQSPLGHWIHHNAMGQSDGSISQSGNHYNVKDRNGFVTGRFDPVTGNMTNAMGFLAAKFR